MYRIYPPFAKLDTLTPLMLSPGKPSAKLRCYGSECRGLIPVASHLAEELLSDVEPREQTIRQATLELHSCYKSASTGEPTHVGVAALAEHCRKLCTLWVALEAVDPACFRIKPKMHLFQEMCEMQPGASPLAHSTYREEEFGGSIAALGRRLG